MLIMPGYKPACKEKHPGQIHGYRIKCESPPGKIYWVKSKVNASQNQARNADSKFMVFRFDIQREKENRKNDQREKNHNMRRMKGTVDGNGNCYQHCH